MRKGQRRKVSGDGNIELSVAYDFWNAVWIYYLRQLQFIAHLYSSF
jgi:hypothetical protein